VKIRHHARQRQQQASRLRPALVHFKLAAASAQGRRHEAQGLPCQDAWARGSLGPLAAMVVCDGAGSAAHAAQGAQLAAQTTLQLLLQQGPALLSMTDEQVKATVLGCVHAALAGAAQRQGLPLRELACTLLLAVSDGRRMLFGQLGDGRVGVCSSSAGWHVLDTGTRGEFANETVFVTSGGALAHFHLVRATATAVTACVLMTDGAEQALLHRATGTLAPAVDTVARWVWAHGTDRVEAALQQQLQTLLRTKTFDDLTLACMSRRPPGIRP